MGTKRAAIYARVSTEDQGRGYSLPTQLEACRRYAQERGFVIVGEFAEEFSGATLDRPQLDRLRDLIATDNIDAVIVYDLDRLSRKAVYQMLIEEEFGRAGVTIHYVLGDYQDNPEGQLQKQIKAAISEYERAKIQERAKRGKKGKAQSGFVLLSIPPYGYRYVSEPHRGHLEIVEDEARVVRLIYTWYVEEGLSTRKIAEKLTKLAIPTRDDKGGRGLKKRKRGVWSPASIYRILTSETYCGVWHFGKSRCEGNKREPKPKDQWVAVRVPAIVSRELWEAAQERRQLNKRWARRNAKHHYLLRGLLRCGHCGRNYYATSKNGRYFYYVCAGRYLSPPGVEACKSPRLRCDRADEAVWQCIEELLLNPRALIAGLRERQAEAEKTLAPLRERLTLVEQAIEDTEKQLAKLLDLYLADELPRALLSEKRKELARRKRELEKERASLQARLEQAAISEDQIAAIDKFCAKVREGLNHCQFEDKRRILEMLNVQGIVKGQDGQVVITLSGYFPDLSVVPTPSGWCRSGRARPPSPKPIPGAARGARRW